MAEILDSIRGTQSRWERDAAYDRPLLSDKRRLGNGLGFGLSWKLFRGICPSSACRHLLPVNGAKGICRDLSVPRQRFTGARVPSPRKTGVRRTGRDEWLDPGKVKVGGCHPQRNCAAVKRTS